MMSGQAQASVAGNARASRIAAGPTSVAGETPGGPIMADDLPDGLVIADRAGCVTVFNRAAGRLTGINPKLVSTAIWTIAAGRPRRP